MAAVEPILQMQHISKSFPGVRALNDVKFELQKGEIHSLMGENGAGKSTLIKVLTGVYEIDEGTILLNGKPVRFYSTSDAQNSGISTVYQEINLCVNLTVAENIYIGREPRKHGSIDWQKINESAKKLLDSLDIHINVERKLSDYSVAIQQMVAIARAVDLSKGILILDEPTSSLDDKEVKQLFKLMRKLKAGGMSIIFVSHFLEQIYEICDRVTILRNGNLIGTYPVAGLSRIDLVSKMIGKDLDELEKLNDIKANSSKKIQEENLLETHEYGKRGLIDPCGLQIKKGEVLGLAGLLGSGRSELAGLLFGIHKADHGTIKIGNKTYSYIYPKKAIMEGFGFCPEDRKAEGITGELTIRENIVLAVQSRQGVLKYIPMKKQEEITRKYIDLLSIKATGPEQRVDHLSGGNQQKVILARWLATDPQLLILDEPTRGIDVGAKSELQKMIIELSNHGMTILFISSELKELVNCCDRILVLRDRRIIGELNREEISEQNIMSTIAEGGLSVG
jgi:simple sugar transport system ATP-binding protein